MDNPCITVVLPVYNGEKHLSQSIDSVLAQTFGNWELIIVDDCSTDGSPKIIQDYTRRDCRIRSVRNQSNQKLPASLNIGFNAAKGKYYTWTSDDNAYLPSAFEQMAKVLEGDARAGLVYAMCQLVDDNGHAVGFMHSINNTPGGVYYANNIGACFLYRASVHEALRGYDETLFLVEDYDFWLRAYAITPFRYIDETLYVYRMHSQSLTQTRKREILLKTLALMQKSVPMDKLDEETRLCVLRRYAEIYAATDQKENAVEAIRKLKKESRQAYLALDEDVRRYPYGGSGAAYYLCSGDVTIKDIVSRFFSKLGFHQNKLE